MSEGGLAPGFVLFIVFLVLKLVGVIGWSWWWVTAPVWGPLGLALLLGIFFLLFRKVALKCAMAVSLWWFRRSVEKLRK